MKSSEKALKKQRSTTLAVVITFSSALFSLSAVGAPLYETFDYPLTDLPTYEPMWEAREAGKSAVHEGGQVTLRLDYTGVGRNRLSLADSSPTDSIAATLTLSSESRVDAGAEIRASVGGQFYNDIQDGGNDGFIGDVFATTRLYQDDEGLKTLFCAFRADSADFGSATTLGPNGSAECGEFALTPAFDTTYNASVSLNRADKTLVFQLGDEQQSIALSTELFLPSTHYTRARAQVVNGTGLVVLGIDDLKTDNIDDDFSYNSLPVLLVRGVADGSGEVVSVTSGEVVDGAIKLSAREDAVTSYNSSRLRVFSKVEESISTTVNVSSESTESVVHTARLYATMFHSGIAYDSDNPHVGNGVALSQIKFFPDGNSFVEACHREVMAGGDQQDIICDRFTTVPKYDTNYQMSINFDRDNSKLVFGLDDEVVEIAVTTPLNVPYRADAYVSADTNGVEVGTAVVSFDNIRIDCPANSQAANCMPRSSGRVEADDTSENTSGSSGGGGSLGWGVILLLTIRLSQRKRGEIK